ncbi:uncharacterized protein LOC134217646 [Armigeres subalbatus]|uniref:uncharacterized protein LOC134217646 n=1 Tax=Armigeres subalbatus TaxID=124917 RepID=UPI002ED1872C
MIFHRIVWIIFFSLILYMCNGMSHFQDCANKLLSNDKTLQCKVSKLEVDGNAPKVTEYMNCAFDGSGWTRNGGKHLDASKVATDMIPYGFNIVNEVGEVTKECEIEFGADISAIDYLSCLLIDERTKKGFRMMLMFKEAEFFKQNLCK